MENVHIVTDMLKYRYSNDQMNMSYKYTVHTYIKITNLRSMHISKDIGKT